MCIRDRLYEATGCTRATRTCSTRRLDAQGLHGPGLHEEGCMKRTLFHCERSKRAAPARTSCAIVALSESLDRDPIRVSCSLPVRRILAVQIQRPSAWIDKLHAALKLRCPRTGARSESLDPSRLVISQELHPGLTAHQACQPASCPHSGVMEFSTACILGCEGV